MANKKKSESSKSQDKTKNNTDKLKISFILSAIAALFFIGAILSIGKSGTAVFSWLIIIICAVAAFFAVPIFIKENKSKDKKSKKFIKSAIAVGLIGVLVLGAIIAMIANPIAIKKRCSVFNNESEMSVGEYSLCKARRAELEQQKQDEENAKKAADEKARSECSEKNYSWNSSENRCNTDDEQAKEKAEEKAKSDCSAKKYNWNYSENRCYTDAEQQAAERKQREEEAKRAEANKTTTYTGKDHDSNDAAGRYDKLMNECWDELEDFWVGGVYILDSDDGYPISYSVTLKGDGTLVEGRMVGTYKANGGKIKDLHCTYKNGDTDIVGID